MTYNETIAAIITSLIASVVFWTAFNLIPKLIERRKLKPLLDFDLYQIYLKLAHFLEIPLYYSKHSPSFLQYKLYAGGLKKDDYRLYLATKCLTEEYQDVDAMAKYLMPIGDNLKTVSNEIYGMIQKLYIFNKYLTAKQILICRKIADKVTTYNYEIKAFEKVGEQILGPVDPTILYMSGMFYETYIIFLQLQDILIKQKPTKNDFGDFYSNIRMRKMELLYSRGNYAKVAKISKGKNDINSNSFYFKSLYRKGNIDKGLAALRNHLQADSTRLIYQRGQFEEFIDDPKIHKMLIEIRSKEEYHEMIDCINREKAQQKAYEDFAREISVFYDNKLKNHQSIVDCN